MKVFFAAAWPWIALAVALAVVMSAMSARKDR